MPSTSKNQTRKELPSLHVNRLENACIRLFDECNRISFTLTHLRWLSSLHTSRIVRFIFASLSLARACACWKNDWIYHLKWTLFFLPVFNFFFFFFPATNREKKQKPYYVIHLCNLQKDVRRKTIGSLLFNFFLLSPLSSLEFQIFFLGLNQYAIRWQCVPLSNSPWKEIYAVLKMT